MKYLTCLFIVEVTLIFFYLNSNQHTLAKESNVAISKPPQQQPLSNLDNVLKQANNIKIDSVIDNKMASNMTNALNEMAMNMRKLFMENRRLSSQVQEVLARVQNVTGVNATNAMGAVQQQATNMTNGSLNLSNLLPRFS